MLRRIRAMFLAVLTLGMACSGAALAQPNGEKAPVENASAAPHACDYRLGAGDKIRISVYGEEGLTGEFFVSGAGKISFPLIGDVDALGKTVPEIQSTIEAKLRDGYLKEPKVSAEVLNYRPFYILGEVMKPGEYPFTNGLTVLNAVATAQGITYRAAKRRVYIRRAATKDEMSEALTPTTPVEPGDTIRIGERLF